MSPFSFKSICVYISRGASFSARNSMRETRPCAMRALSGSAADRKLKSNVRGQTIGSGGLAAVLENSIP